MSAAREHLMKKAQHQMLRTMTKITRKVNAASSDTESSRHSENDSDVNEIDVEDTLEPFIDWLRRATHISEDIAHRNGVQDWVVAQQAC